MLNLLEWITQNCFTTKGLNNRVCLESWWYHKGFVDKLQEIYDLTAWVQTDNISQRLYHIIHQMDSIPQCQNIHCKKLTTFKQFKSGYNDFCSRECSYQGINRNEQISQKVKISHNSKAYKNKIKQTYLQQKKVEKYGTLFVPNFGKESKAELELLDFLNSTGHIFAKNQTILDNLEIDAYCEQLKLGFEYCSLYWHSEQHKKPWYHFFKMQKCQEKGIRLITIFEDEWLHKQTQVKQFILATLGIFKQRVFGRLCDVREVVDKPFDFFEKYHIQGRPHSIKRAFGLFFEDRMVGCVSYGIHHRYNNILTLNRLAFESGIQYIGGASKLIKNSLQILQECVITWSDNRWSTGEIYRTCGFQLDGELKFDYSYVDSKNFKRINKQSMKKANIECPSTITEHAWCLQHNIYRIYDCGKKRWKYTIGAKI